MECSTPIDTKQFVSAIATAALTRIEASGSDEHLLAWSLTHVDADFDDESGQTELEFEISIGAQSGRVEASLVSFQVTILAAD